MTPLTRLRTQAEAALRDPNTDTQRAALETTLAESDKLIRTFNALLMIARAEAGAPSGAFADVDVSAVAADVAELYEPVAEEQGIVLESRIASDVHLRANRELIGQALVNLIENALRHGEGTVTLGAVPAHNGETAVGRRRLEGCVDLVVSDNGKGIDPAHRELVFSRFWHGSGRGSTGLGLYVVKGLVEAHGGRIVVENAPSGGAQFRFSLPTEPPDYLA